jgi:hypothetical protein
MRKGSDQSSATKKRPVTSHSGNGAGLHLSRTTTALPEYQEPPGISSVKSVKPEDVISMPSKLHESRPDPEAGKLISLPLDAWALGNDVRATHEGEEKRYLTLDMEGQMMGIALSPRKSVYEQS